MDKRIVFFIMILGFSKVAFAEPPEWTQDSGRQVVGGDIVHWGTGDAETSEIAVFKARHMAIKTLLEECGGIANKYIVPRKQHVESSVSGYRAWALVSLDFPACEAAKKPGAHRLENSKIAEGQKLYDRLLMTNKDSDEAKKTEKEIRDLIRSNAEVVDEQIGTLRDEIETLRAEIHQPAPQIVPVSLPSTNTMRVMCDAQYQAMRQRMAFHSADFNGNMAAPELMEEFNEMEAQRSMCARLK